MSATTCDELVFERCLYVHSRCLCFALFDIRLGERRIMSCLTPYYLTEYCPRCCTGIRGSAEALETDLSPSVTKGENYSSDHALKASVLSPVVLKCAIRLTVTPSAVIVSGYSSNFL